jgi:hypothetical protein
LPSEPLVIQRPDLGYTLDLTLYWPGIANATAYRVYRTTAPNQKAGDERLLAEVPHAGAATDRQELLDDGTLDNSAATETPMPLGSLGVWHDVGGDLTTAREGAALVVAPDPNDESKYYLYVLGGRDGAGAALDDYEWAAITASASNNQVVDPLDVGASTLPAGGGRWLMGGVYVDHKRSANTGAEDLWVYVLAGVDGAGGTVSDVDAFQVDVAGSSGGTSDDGRLGGAVPVANLTGNWSAYGYVAGNGYIHALGGSLTQTGGKEATLDAPAPTLGNWNAGADLNTPRYLPASAYESAFIYLIGGQQTSTTTAASRSVERTNF